MTSTEKDRARHDTLHHLAPTYYPNDIIHELLTKMAEHFQDYEHDYSGKELSKLLHLIRMNPQDLAPDYTTLREARHARDPRYSYLGGERRVAFLYAPSPIDGVPIYLSARHPLMKFLKIHFPPEHLIWRFARLTSSRP